MSRNEASEWSILIIFHEKLEIDVQVSSSEFDHKWAFHRNLLILKPRRHLISMHVTKPLSSTILFENVISANFSSNIFKIKIFDFFLDEERARCHSPNFKVFKPYFELIEFDLYILVIRYTKK